MGAPLPGSVSRAGPGRRLLRWEPGPAGDVTRVRGQGTEDRFPNAALGSEVSGERGPRPHPALALPHPHAGAGFPQSPLSGQDRGWSSPWAGRRGGSQRPAHPCPAAPADAAARLGALGPPASACGPGRETWTVSPLPRPRHFTGRFGGCRPCGRAQAATVRALAGTLLHAVGAPPGHSLRGPGCPGRCVGQGALPHPGWASQACHRQGERAGCGVSVPRGCPGCWAFLLFLGTLGPAPSISGPSPACRASCMLLE